MAIQQLQQNELEILAQVRANADEEVRVARERNVTTLDTTLDRRAWDELQDVGLLEQARRTPPARIDVSPDRRYSPPIATVAVDVDGDGRADYLVSGVDRDGDGIPDALQNGTRSSSFSTVEKIKTTAIDAVDSPMATKALEERSPAFARLKAFSSEKPSPKTSPQGTDSPLLSRLGALTKRIN